MKSVVNFRRSPTSMMPLSGLQILVVEDDSDTREMLAFVLQRNGAGVLAAASVQSALDLIAQTPPDAIVADIGLPEYNGYALIARIREMGGDNGWKPICVAVTAYATQIDRDTALSSGYDAYIAKPFDPAELVRTIAKLSPSRQ